MREEINVSKAVLKAEAELQNDPQPPPDRNVEGDWLFRWRDAASKVSSEKLQELWGRVLAGEIKSPGSCSLRTLEFLKNISQEEALKIANMSPFVIDNSFLFRGNKEELESKGITFMFLQYLQELGIVAGVEAIGINYTVKSHRSDKFESHFVSHDRVLLVTHEDASKELKFQVYPLTSLGKQVLRLGSFSAHESYFRSFGRHICTQGYAVKIANWTPVTEAHGRYFNPKDLDG